MNMKTGYIPPAEVDAYPIHDDGGLIYTPLSNEFLKTHPAAPTGEMASGVLELDGIRLEYEIPVQAGVYDMIPVRYTLTQKDTKTPIHVYANANEDPDRGSPDAYNLHFPGVIDVTYEYLGHVTATAHPENRPLLSADVTEDRRSVQYPHFTRQEESRSGVIKASDYVWFHFRYTNTGNTILDSNGNAMFAFKPVIWRKNDAGEFEYYRKPENIWYRLLDELYPGESRDFWITGLPSFMEPGEYKLVLQGMARCETGTPEDIMVACMDGACYTESAFFFRVEEEARFEEPLPPVKGEPRLPTRNTWLHTFEEFTASYTSWLAPQPGAVSDVLYVKCAPWTRQIVLRLLVGDELKMASAAVPVCIDKNAVSVQFNPDNRNFVVLEDGKRYPALASQNMTDMRGNVQLGPEPEKYIIGFMDKCKSLGIRLLMSTSGFEFDHSFGEGASDNTDAFWFSTDVMRKMNLNMEGYTTYVVYPREPVNVEKAEWEFPDRVAQLKQTGMPFEDLHAYSIGLKSMYQYDRWGDNYWVSPDGDLVLAQEDIIGWLRIDLQTRHWATEYTRPRFIACLKEKYGTLEAVNRAWGSDYAAFEDIDPDEGAEAIIDGHWMLHKCKDAKFPEWSAALADYDYFRTQDRVQRLEKILSVFREREERVKLDLRTEGSDAWLVDFDPQSRNSHHRQSVYAQRRAALVPQVLRDSELLYGHCEYFVMPYTPSEVYDATRRSVEGGIVPMPLIQASRMRDMAVNSKWGVDYSSEYNLVGENTKAAYMNVVGCVFEWFKAIYEGGGVPGILPQDYLCGGYITSMQEKELRFFKEKLDEALQTPEGKAWSESFRYDTSAREASKGCYCYDPAYVETLIRQYSQSEK